uniref:Uncharacterized protein n=1 Tax=Anguilla anguilla TaxID=7936 RepID=A0A0E9V668_ANGAN
MKFPVLLLSSNCPGLYSTSETRVQGFSLKPDSQIQLTQNSTFKNSTLL